MPTKHLYRVSFINQGKVYEIYCRNIKQDKLLGFVEIEDLVFGERSSVVVDPAEDKLKSEFAGVTRSHIPMHAVIRIDEVSKQGHAKITQLEGSSNVSAFPSSLYSPPKPPSQG
ncbi:MAG TPA: DUF1820 family protein [Gammaproteobacteria bacterium]|nr:DUF1820 family protein [Gammaproteobacteria bacterium]